MRNNGFTLIELLGVIVILSVLITIISVSVGSVLENSESKLTSIQIAKIEEAAKNYYINEGMEEIDFEEGSFKHCVSVNYLLENGYIDESESANMDKNDYLNASVKISYDSKKYKYTYEEKSCHICEPVTNETRTTGNVPTGNFSSGDEYICEVKEGTKYNFFVLSVEDDKINLILDRNLGLSVWNYYGSSSYGPVTAMNYLHDKTKDWDNITNIKVNYKDEIVKGYTGIVTEGNKTQIIKKNGDVSTTYTNLKARLPMYYEVFGDGRCPVYSTVNFGGCPLWLVNYLKTSPYYSSGFKSDESYTGYYTLASQNTIDRANYVYYKGVMGGLTISIESGIRPVISVEKDKIYPSDRW